MSDEDCEPVSLGVVGSDMCNDREILQAAEILGLEVVFIPDIDKHDFFDEDVFLVSNFDSSEYKKLRQAKQQAIIGPPYLLLKAATSRTNFVAPTKPVFCLAMDTAIVCITGIHNEDTYDELISRIIKMGARVKSEVTLEVTHLVAASTYSSKYRLAVSLGCNIVSTEWVHQSWAQKEEHLFSALDKDFVGKYKLPPFYHCKLSVYGFCHDEQSHMEDIALDNGSDIVDANSDNVEIVVIDDARVSFLPEFLAAKEGDLKIVRAEWFWVSVQMQVFARPEMFPFHDKSSLCTPLHQKAKTPRSGGPSGTTPNSKKTKRRRLQDNLSLLAQDDHSISPLISRFDKNYTENGSVIIDSPDFRSCNTESNLSPCTPQNSGASCFKTPTQIPSDEKMLVPKSKRHGLIMELYQTETNYLSILNTVVKEFKEPLESEEASGNPLIEPEDRKTIFDKITSLYSVHTKIQSQLCDAIKNWNEDKCSIGQIFLDHIDELQKSYPPFVNFFEIAKSTLERCDKCNPRFHAFLKVRATKPECGRQSLSELFIRPVQRLPSVVLLISDLLKKTDSSHLDYKCLEECLDKLKGVTCHINEDKRKTESRLEMLTIANTIENIPAVIISSHRQLVANADVLEIGNQISSKTDQLTLFLFSDCLLIAKRKNRPTKSPGQSKNTSTPQQKSYKYLAVVNLGQVKRIVDIEPNGNLDFNGQNEDSKKCAATCGAFALVFKPQTESVEKIFAFNLTEEYEFNKSEFIKKIAQQMSITQMRPDSENLITNMAANELNLDLQFSEHQNTTFTKAISNVAKKTSIKVSKALSGSAGKSSHRTNEMAHYRTASSHIASSVTPIRSASRGFLFSKRLASTVDLSTCSNMDEEEKSKRKRTLPDRTSVMAESSLSLSTNQHLMN